MIYLGSKNRISKHILPLMLKKEVNGEYKKAVEKLFTIRGKYGSSRN